MDDRGAKLREGDSGKRAAIIEAAQNLFSELGYDRVKTETIADTAGVSKRTVYDYFGGKTPLFEAVVNHVRGSLHEKVRAAALRRLGPAVADPRAEKLDRALRLFALDVVASTTSSDYAVLRRLLATCPPTVTFDPTELSTPELTLADYLRKFHAAGILDAADADTAADHFVALTVLSVVNKTDHRFSRIEPDVRRLIASGTQAFLRAYRAEQSAA